MYVLVLLEMKFACSLWEKKQASLLSHEKRISGANTAKLDLFAVAPCVHRPD
jgi:hypothetical protein